MDRVIWVEILSRQREVTARVRVAGPELHIGRGYDNDVIVDDPYVAPRHMRVSRDETGRLIAEDLGSANGMFLDRDRRPQARIIVDGERPIRIGHTWIRIREATHAVADERAGKPARVLPLVTAMTLVAAILGVEVLALWASEVGEVKASYYLLPLLTIAVPVAVWVSVWAVLSRIFSGTARFGRNLLITLSIFLVLSLYNDFALFSAFALTWRIPTDYAYVALWCALAAAGFLHLREVGPSRLKLKGALVVMLLALAIGVQTLTQSEAFDDTGRQVTFRRLLPPSLRLVPIRKADSFFADIAQLKSKLDVDRTAK